MSKACRINVDFAYFWSGRWESIPKLGILNMLTDLRIAATCSPKRSKNGLIQQKALGGIAACGLFLNLKKYGASSPRPKLREAVPTPRSCLRRSPNHCYGKRVSSDWITSGLPFKRPRESRLPISGTVYQAARSVSVAASVHQLIDLAVGRRLGIVHVVDDGLQGFDLGEDSSNVFVSHAAVNSPGHDLI